MTFSYIADTFQDTEIIVAETVHSEDDKFTVFENSLKIPGIKRQINKENKSEI